MSVQTCVGGTAPEWLASERGSAGPRGGVLLSPDEVAPVVHLGMADV